MRFLLSICFLIIATPIFGQKVTSVEVSTGSDVTVGEHVQLSYVIDMEDIKEGEVVIDFDNVSNIEFDENEPTSKKILDIDLLRGSHPSIMGNKLTTKVGKDSTIAFKIGVFDEGKFRLPTPSFHSRDEEREFAMKEYLLTSRFATSNGNLDLDEIKDIVRTENDGASMLYYIGGILLVSLLFFYLAYNLMRRYSSILDDSDVSKVLTPKIPPHVKARIDLEELRDKMLWQHGNEKGYHSELTRIMKKYLFRRYKVNTMEMTTDEIIRSLMVVGIDSDQMATLKNILNIADVVKFAKANAGDKINEQFLEDALAFVSATKGKEGYD